MEWPIGPDEWTNEWTNEPMMSGHDPAGCTPALTTNTLRSGGGDDDDDDDDDEEVPGGG